MKLSQKIKGTISLLRFSYDESKKLVFSHNASKYQKFPSFDALSFHS